MSIINEEVQGFLLREALENVDIDINRLYDIYFRDDIEEFQRTKKVESSMFQKHSTNTSILQTDICRKAHAQNPCEMNINYGINGYDPNKKIIYLSIHKSATELIKSEGGLDKALKVIPITQHMSFKNEFTEHKIKGSINHELYHWLDDTLNNSHLQNRINTANEIGRDKYFKGKNVNTTKFEIQGQMGNIAQIKAATPEKEYNRWSFNDLLSKSPTLLNIYRTLPIEDRDEWMKNLFRRMHRENLLGNKMKFK